MKDLKGPDEVLTGMHRFLELLGKYRLQAGIGAGAVLVLILAVYFMQKHHQSSAVEQSEALTGAMAGLVPVAPTKVPTDDGDITIEEGAEKKAERLKKAVEALQAARGKYGDSGILKLAWLGEAAAYAEMAQHDKAVEAIRAYAAKTSSDPFEPAVRESLGIHLAAQGKAAEAEAEFNKLAASSDAYLKALAHMDLGDLANPSMGKPDGKARDKAVAAYKAALEALKAQGGNLRPSEQFLKAEAEKRLALLGAPVVAEADKPVETKPTVAEPAAAKPDEARPAEPKPAELPPSPPK